MTDWGFVPDWPVPAGVRSWQTLRHGGISDGPYHSLNLGSHVGDAAEAVRDNRARLLERLRLPAEPAWLKQVHGTQVIDLDRDSGREGDAAMTATPGTVVAILTADCLPVLLSTRAGDRVGAAHAGWRGLAAGVLTQAVRRLGGEPKGIQAWLGPAIGPRAFEVGDEVREAFMAQGPDAEAAFQRNDRGRWQADLYALARLQLAAAGVERISGGGFCTFSEAGRFFSHRKAPPCGRQATLIWLESRS